MLDYRLIITGTVIVIVFLVFVLLSISAFAIAAYSAYRIYSLQNSLVVVANNMVVLHRESVEKAVEIFNYLEFIKSKDTPTPVQ